MYNIEINNEREDWLIMKKLVVFVFMIICLCCNSVMCFAGSKITTEYYEKNNEIFQEYEQLVSLGISGKTKVKADFVYDKRYQFNKDFDVVTKQSKPNDLLFIMFWDYNDELKYLKNEIVLTELETGKAISVPFEFSREKYSNSEGVYHTLSGGLAPIDIPALVDLVLDNKPFKITFNFFVSPRRGMNKNLTFDFNKEELEKLKSVINYDLYSDPSQTENIKKAVAAIPAN